MIDMIQKEKIYKVYMWMWELEQKHMADEPISEEEWSKILESSRKLCEELKLGRYERRLMSNFMATKEGIKKHIIVKLTKETILE